MLPDWTLAPVVAALQTMRGMVLVNAATLIAELGDLSRFADPRQLMGYLVIVETWSDRRCWLIEPVSLCLQAAMSFSFASGIGSRKVCIGVLPKHQRP